MKEKIIPQNLIKHQKPLIYQVTCLIEWLKYYKENMPDYMFSEILDNTTGHIAEELKNLKDEH